MPLPCQRHLVRLHDNLIAFTVVIKARTALIPFDISLGNERKHTVCSLHQCRIAPSVAPSLFRNGCTAESSDRLYLIGRVHWEIALIGLCPLHEPALRSLRNHIYSILLRLLLVLKACIFISECNTIIVKSDHHVCILTDRSLVLVRLVCTMQALAFQHLIVILHLSDKGQGVERHISHMKGLLVFVTYDQLVV